MPLAPGTRLGHFEVVALIGAGGMGEVYRAIDSRLGRGVALKTIGPRGADTSDWRARFRVEAEAIASLTHQHICRLYDVGHHAGIDFLVMELVEGDTLASQLTRGPLPAERALGFARALASAVGYAHRRGIVHRDVKPANVIVTSDGVKLLDFGVARIIAPAPIEARDPTIAASVRPLTDIGQAVGTWQYMAPEQIRGGPVDSRTDVFALGAVIFEMFAGRPAFAGATHHDLVSAILRDDPTSMTASNPTIPPAIDKIVRTCLAKDPGDRWHSGDDLLRALESVAADTPVVALALPPRWRWRWRWQTAGVTALVAAAAVSAAILLKPYGPGPAPPLVRSTLVLGPEMLPFETDVVGSVAVSPDGRTIVYEAERNGRWQLFRWRLDGTTGDPIAGTENGRTPFFSPDGEWVGFSAGRQLKKIPAAGGTSITICDIDAAFGASWGPDGTIALSLRSNATLFRVAATGGTPEPMPTLPAAASGDDARWPQWLAEERAVLYAIGTGPGPDSRIVVTDVATGAHAEVLRGVGSARFVAPDKLVYARAGELYVARFDVRQRQISGPHQKIADGVAEGPRGAPEYAFSAAGDLVYVPGRHNDWQHRLMLVDMSGSAIPLAVPPGSIASPRVSPDGRHLAYTMSASKSSIWVHSFERGTSTRVSDERIQGAAVWISDGRLAMAEGGATSTALFTRAIDGTDKRVVVRNGLLQLPEAWVPDGERLIYSALDPRTGWDLLAAVPNAPPQPLAATRASERMARVSPDGRWLAYQSDEGGAPHISIRSLDGTGNRIQVSSLSTRYFAWSPDSRRLYYRAVDPSVRARADLATGTLIGTMFAVDVRTTPALGAGPARKLFDNIGFGGDFDVTADGTKFVMVKVDTARRLQELRLVQNVAAVAQP